MSEDGHGQEPFDSVERDASDDRWEKLEEEYGFRKGDMKPGDAIVMVGGLGPVPRPDELRQDEPNEPETESELGTDEADAQAVRVQERCVDLAAEETAMEGETVIWCLGSRGTSKTTTLPHSLLADGQRAGERHWR